MYETIITGICVILAALAGAWISNRSASIQSKISSLKDKNVKLNKKMRKAYNQIISYHLLEELYANHLSTLIEEKRKTKKIKEDFRTKIVEKHNCDRPSTSANEARKLIKNLN